MEELIQKLETLALSEPACSDIYSYPTITQPSPKIAFFIMGPAAAGKSTLYKSLFPTPSTHYYYNFDNYYESLLAINQPYQAYLEKTFSPDTAKKKVNSMHAKLMNLAKKCIAQDFPTLLKSNNTLVIDTPGVSADTIKYMYQQLKKHKYPIYGIFKTATEATLQTQNKQRKRQLPEKAILYIYTKTTANKPLFESWFPFIEDPTPEKINALLSKHGTASQKK